MDEIKNLKKLCVFLLIVSISLFLIISGKALNTFVIDSNDGKMPVFSSYHYTTETHFTYQEKSQVNYPFLTDWIKCKPNYKCSVGDMTMFFGFVLFLVSSFSSIYYYHQLRKLKKCEE